MEQTYTEGATFEKTDFTGNGLPVGDYENCTFSHCDLSGTDLSRISFIDCDFDNCNLSTARLTETAFKEVRFNNCKLLGLHFEDCTDFLFQVHFDNCVLDLACFYKRKLKKTLFRKTSLQEADFSEADLSGAVFDECNLAGAAFDNTLLEKADFRTAYNYSLDPENNRIKKAKFSQAGLSGLLDKYDIDIE